MRTLSEYILERLSSKSDMALVEFRIIMSFPKRSKYRTSVSRRDDEKYSVEESVD